MEKVLLKRKKNVSDGEEEEGDAVFDGTQKVAKKTKTLNRTIPCGEKGGGWKGGEGECLGGG